MLTSFTKILASSVKVLVGSRVVGLSVVDDVLVAVVGKGVVGDVVVVVVLVVEVVVEEVVVGGTEVIEVLGSVDSGVVELEVFMSSFRPPLDGVGLKLLLVTVVSVSSFDGVKIKGLRGFHVSVVVVDITVVSGISFLSSGVLEKIVDFSVDVVVSVILLGNMVVSGSIFGICVAGG